MNRFLRQSALLFAVTASLLSGVSEATINNLLPRPRHIKITGEPVEARRHVTTLIVDSIPGVHETALHGFPAEAYTLTINDSAVIIRAVTPRGVIRAGNTLAQLRESAGDYLPSVEITDWPAFPLRGFMHDTGRSFIPVDTLMDHIELLSRYKINTFHWHLTENQAWRLAVDDFPQLTADTSMTRHPGRYYTKDDTRRLEAYAAERGVTVIPEIDMPGHSRAFTHAMGFDMQTPEGEAALSKILEHVAEAFPMAPWIHIGGDEVAIRRGGFLRRMTDKVRSLGRKAIVWNPIHGTTINDSVGADMTQMWSTAGRVIKGIPNIDCRYLYANHFDPYADVAAIYRSNIYYQPEASPDIAGSIVAFWNDRKLPDARAIVRDNSFFPASLALAERAWTGGGNDYIERLGCLLPNDGPEYDEFADWERRFLYHKDHTLIHQPVSYVRQADVRWAITEPIDINEPFTSDLRKYPATGGTIYLRHYWGKIIPALFTDAKPGVKVKATTRVWSDADTICGAIIETQNYSRSEKDLAPQSGTWDGRGSEIRINGKLVTPPVWANSGLRIDHESLLLNENATARRPVPVKLNKGWNDIEAILPYTDVPGIRLDKWMLTFILTDPTGSYALDCIRYEPDLGK